MRDDSPLLQMWLAVSIQGITLFPFPKDDSCNYLPKRLTDAHVIGIPCGLRGMVARSERQACEADYGPARRNASPGAEAEPSKPR